MQLGEAIVESITDHPDEWVVDGDIPAVELGLNDTYNSCFVMTHPHTGLRIAVERPHDRMFLWSPRAKMWNQSGDLTIAPVCHAWRNRLNYEDMYGDRLAKALAGEPVEFTETARALARAVLDGRAEAAFGAVDEILNTMQRPQGTPDV